MEHPEHAGHEIPARLNHKAIYSGSDPFVGGTRKASRGRPHQEASGRCAGCLGSGHHFRLLTHTSGIPSFTGFPAYRTSKLVSTPIEQIVASFRDKTLEFQPGEKWNYRNSGYLLLGYLIEKISGQTYEQFVRENIFTPLGMKDSGYDSHRTVIPQRAAGYSPSPNGPVNADFIDMSIPHGAGALYSTTDDLLRWTQGLFGGKLVSPASLEKMTTPFKNDYALGIQVRTLNGRKVIDHGGGIEGFNTTLAYYPESKLTIAVLAN